MSVVDAISIKRAYHNHKEVSSLRVGNNLVWEHPSLLIIKTVSGNNIQVPSWAVAVSIALIGGGGGGQSGNGTNRGSGRPGAAANWAVYYQDLDRHPDQDFYLNIVVGSGGSGGGNSDHDPGAKGGATTATLLRNAGGAISILGSYRSDGGLGGPASGLPIESTSTRPNSVTAPREVPASPNTLPRGTAASKEQVGGSPGAGGGYGGGGYFGARGTGGNGGNGMARLYFYGAP